MLFLFFYGGQPVCVYAQTQKELPWNILETKYTLIHYQSEDDLEKFNSKIDYGPKKWGLGRLFSKAESNSMADRLVMKMDLLFERVQEILEMRKKFNKVNIKLYKNKNQLHEAFTRIYKKPCQIRTWYRYRDNTVHVQVEDFNENMLAHELAHAVVDHYLLVRPPTATAEILARYVDMNLHW